jgi:hypothetical protein
MFVLKKKYDDQNVMNQLFNFFLQFGGRMWNRSFQNSINKIMKKKIRF